MGTTVGSKVTLTDELVDENRPATGEIYGRARGGARRRPTERREPRSISAHPFGQPTQPVFPGYKDIDIRRGARHASHGVMTQRVVAVLSHTGTHVKRADPPDPRWSLPRRAAARALLPAPASSRRAKGRWELIRAGRPRSRAGPAVEPGDIVLIKDRLGNHFYPTARFFGRSRG